MSHRPLMDAGPGLNFFSLNRERLLFSVVGAVSIPEVVDQEIKRKTRQDERFAAAARVLAKVPVELLQVLPDEVSVELAVAVHRIAGVPAAQRLRASRDLGELMVVAHAAVAAQRGGDLIVLIDDGIPPWDATDLMTLLCWSESSN